MSIIGVQMSGSTSSNMSFCNQCGQYYFNGAQGHQCAPYQHVPYYYQYPQYYPNQLGSLEYKDLLNTIQKQAEEIGGLKKELELLKKT